MLRLRKKFNNDYNSTPNSIWMQQNFLIIRAHKVEIFSRNMDKPLYDSFHFKLQKRGSANNQNNYTRLMTYMIFGALALTCLCFIAGMIAINCQKHRSGTIPVQYM